MKKTPAGSCRSGTLGLLVCVASIALSACGAEDQDSSHSPSSSTSPAALSPSTVSSPPPASPSEDSRNKADIIAAVQAFAQASTPEQACAAVSDGFAMFFGNGNPEACVSNIVAASGGHLTDGTAQVRGVHFTHGQAVVSATVPPRVPQVSDYYLVHTAAGWKVNSIGELHLGGPSSP